MRLSRFRIARPILCALVATAFSAPAVLTPAASATSRASSVCNAGCGTLYGANTYGLDRYYPVALSRAGEGSKSITPSLGSTGVQSARVGTVVTAAALQVASLHPGIALATSQTGSADQQTPALPAFRTTDGGRTWSLLHLPDDLTAPPNPYGVFSYDPPLMALDGTHLYINERYQSSPDASNQGIASSSDGGAHWTLDNPQDAPVGGAGGDQIVALSPISPAVTYAYEQDQGGASLLRSTTYGARYENMTDPATLAPTSGAALLDTLLPDAALPHILYALVSDSESDQPLFVARSTDDGAAWHKVRLPTGFTPATARLSVDAHLPGRLIVRAAGSTDRLYSSADGGATWQRSLCPGDLHGACPAVVVENAFGDGRSYGLYSDGLHAFSGAGAAGPRLAANDLMPLPPRDIVTLAAGGHAGDPLFVAGATDPTVTPDVYSRTDGGRHWQRAVAGLLPSMAAPDHSSGALYVPHARHSVAPAFVSLYRRLGPTLLGDPLDEAYQVGGETVQDFAHMELVAPPGRRAVAAIAPLGTDRCARLCPAAARRVAAARPNTSGVTYVAATHHTVRGAFLTFWRQHQQALGDPISEEFTASNSDGSGRGYVMQYFTNARLEWHPEYHNARYAVQLGLLGVEALAGWGWTRSS